ncbi:MAG TPA: cyclic nucleotide-binding domain-containing protein [Polyangia bacterium]|nr:cyclic nucleotide-binding domain-containing protein [Polyangia bacterium]
MNESDGQDAPPGAAEPPQAVELPEAAQPFPRAADQPGKTLRGGLHVELDAEPANPAAVGDAEPELNFHEQDSGAAAAAPAPAAPQAPPAAAPVTGVSIPADQALQLLARINLFSGLQPSYLRHIANLGLEENYDPGALIFAEGAQGDKVYLILSGAVRISRQVPGMGEEALAVLRAGTYFGEMALIDDFPRSADARAHEACRLFVIRKEDLEDLLFVDRDLAYDLLWSFVRTLSSRLRETNDKMTFLAVTNKF